MADTLVVAPVATYTGASATNGGGYSAAYGGTFAQTHSTGGPVSLSGAWNSSQTGCTVTEPVGGTTRATSAGNFANALVGMIVNIEFPTTTAENDWYVLTAVNNDYVEFALAPTDSTCDAKVGGFFAMPNTADVAGIVAGGDIVAIIKGTYTLVGANWTMTAGSAGLPVIYKTIDENGDDVLPTRALQGGRATGDLDTTVMAEIDCGSYQVIPANYAMLKALNITNANNEEALYAISNDNIQLVDCVVHNQSSSGTTAKALRLDDNCFGVNCDFISDSTTLTSAVARFDSKPRLKNCRIKSLSTAAATLLDVSVGVGGHDITNCIFWGASSNVTGVKCDSGTSVQSLDHLTFYNCGKSIEIVSGTSHISATNCLVVDCTSFLYNSSTADITVISKNNCIDSDTTAYTGATYGFNGVDGDGDVSFTEVYTDIFEWSVAGDFRIKSGITPVTPVSAAMFSNDCGAITNVAAGGSGGVAQLINGGLLV